MSKYIVFLLFVIFYAILPFTVNAQSLPRAFNQAQGFGQNTIGGRTGQILFVTNLNDEGNGSLRDAVSKNFPRIVIFKVSGTIELKSPIEIKNSFITIAGNSSPSKGILVKGNGIKISANNVIITNLRLRPGDNAFEDGFLISNSNNVVLNNVSVNWYKGTGIRIYGLDKQNGNTKITIQNSLIGESFNNANANAIRVYGGFSEVSFINNLILTSNQKDPIVSNLSSFDNQKVEFINNAFYNISNYLELKGKLDLNLLNNLIVEKDFNTTKFKFTDSEASKINAVLNKIIRQNTTNQVDVEYDCSNCPIFSTTSRSGIIDTLNLVDYLKNNVGTVLKQRDLTDVRIVNQVSQKSGFMINSVQEVGGYEDYPFADAFTDKDLDGMLDEWEVQYNLNTTINDSQEDFDNDGYTNIEEFIFNENPGESPAGICTNFTYSNWSSCTNGSQTRTVINYKPDGCVGGSPILKQSCTPSSYIDNRNNPTRTPVSYSSNNYIDSEIIIFAALAISTILIGIATWFVAFRYNR